MTPINQNAGGEVMPEDVFRAFIAGKPANTQRAYRQHLAKIAAFLDIEFESKEYFEALIQFSPARAMLYFDWLCNQGLKGQTVNQYIRTARQFFEYLRDVGLIDRNPIGKHLKASKEPVSQAKLISDRLVHQMLDLPGRDEKGLSQRAMLALLFYSGLRISEIVRLKWSQVNWSDSYLEGVITKGSKKRDVLLHQIPFKALKRLSKKRFQVAYTGSHFIFKSTYSGKHVSYKTAYRFIKRVFSEVGLEDGYSPHSGRATAITNLLDQGFSHREVMAFSGHESVQMVERYDRKRKTLESPAASLAYNKK
jgi:integrase/recombinase XerD